MVVDIDMEMQASDNKNPPIDRFVRLFTRINLGFPDTLKETQPLINDVDWFIDMFTHYRTKLNKHRNSFISVNKLPEEILLRIFYHCSPSAAFDEDEYEIPRDTLTFTHVCHYWRTLALSAPILWAAPIFRWTPEAASETLSRARDAPLKIYAVIWKDFKGVIHQMMLKLPNIRYLSLTGRTSYLVSYLSLYSRPAPNLEELKLTISKERSKTTLEPTLFAGDAPRLRTLELRNCMLDWRSPLLANITTLQLTADVQWPRSITVANLLATFEHTPKLEDFMLEEALKKDSVSQPLSLPNGSINLPCMKRFEIHDDITCITLILQYISLPVDTCLFIYDETHPEALLHQEIRRLFVYLETCPHLTRGPKPFWMYVDGGGNLLSLRVKTHSGKDSQLTVGLSLDDEGEWDEEAPSVGYMFAQIAHHVPFDDLVTLYVRNLDDEDSFLVSDVSFVLEHLTRLTTLYLSHEAVEPFLCGLNSLQYEDPDKAVLPALKALHLQDVDLAEAVTMFGRTSSPSLMANLKKILDLRTDRLPWPLSSLHLWRCIHGEIYQRELLAEFAQNSLASLVDHIEVSSTRPPFPPE